MCDVGLKEGWGVITLMGSIVRQRDWTCWIKPAPCSSKGVLFDCGIACVSPCRQGAFPRQQRPGRIRLVLRAVNMLGRDVASYCTSSLSPWPESRNQDRPTPPSPHTAP